jgi:hypothetical protein
MRKPAYVEIVFADHVYTATVYDVKSLERFCRECCWGNRKFRFGSIKQYGSINLERLAQVMNRQRISAWYDPDISKVND